jgi:mono/diheme cytochrome c family protein
MRRSHLASRANAAARRGAFAAMLAWASASGLAPVLGGCGGSILPHEAVQPVAAALPGLDTPEGVGRFWSTNCAGCHGAEGTHGAARPLNDPRWWRTMPDAQIVEATAVGLGRLMPGFSKRAAGGPYIAYQDLGDPEIELLVKGLRARWETPGEPAAAGSRVRLGDAVRGEAIFHASCVSCHAADGRMSVTDPFYLANITDQGLWSAVVFGRIDLGKPPSELAPPEIADVVAYLVAQRPAWAAASVLVPRLPAGSSEGAIEGTEGATR